MPNEAKKLIMIGGTMGIGKTTVCNTLYKTINNSVWLDGDWCWMMHPWNFSEANKKMVFENIVYLLNNYLSNDFFRVIIFSWVLHNDEIYQDLLASLQYKSVDIQKISLLANPLALRERLQQNGASATTIGHSVERLKCYKKLNTIKIDTSNLSVIDVVEEIRKICGFNNFNL